MRKVIATKRTYIPKWDGNRSLPEAEQIVAHYKVSSLAEKARLVPRPEFKARYDQAGAFQGTEADMSFDGRPLVTAMLVKLDNVEYEDEDGVHRITNAKELYAAPPEYDGLARELGEFFRDELEGKPDEKN